MVKETNFKARCPVKRKETLEHMLTNEWHNVLAHTVLGRDSTLEQRTEGFFSVGTVLPGALATTGGGDSYVFCAKHGYGISFF